MIRHWIDETEEYLEIERQVEYLRVIKEMEEKATEEEKKEN